MRAFPHLFAGRQRLVLWHLGRPHAPPKLSNSMRAKISPGSASSLPDSIRALATEQKYQLFTPQRSDIKIVNRKKKKKKAQR